MIFKRPFLTFFLDFGSPKTLKIKPKRCTVCKKRVSTLFDKSPHFLEQIVKKELQMTPKCLQNGAQSGPKTIQRALRTQKHELLMNSWIFGRPGAPKQRQQIIKKLEKPDSGTLFYSLKKPWFPRHLFCCFFNVLEATKPWKSSQNAVLYAKIVGRHFLLKVYIFKNLLNK